MTEEPKPLPRDRRARRRRLGAALVTGALCLATVPLGPGSPAASALATSGQETVTARTDLSGTNAPTAFRISSFNLLGAGHTDGGNRDGWASGWTRMGWAVELIGKHGLDVIGFQELQDVQFRRFRELAGDDFGIYPGNKLSAAAMHNSITWRRAEWRLVEAQTLPIPYFDGHPIRMPYVLLRNVETGRKAWFFNTHNPADAHGDAQKWRDEGFRMEIDLVNRLRRESPGVPVFSTGDKNDHEEYFCPLAQHTDMEAANGGSYADGVCSPPPAMKVDWVMGSEEVVFSGYRALRDEEVSRVTDHPLVISDATVPSPRMLRSPIRRVLVLSVEGLAPRAIRRAGAEGAPALHRMMRRGASTLNARTLVERTTRLPNLVGMLTGRPVDPDRGGHGVGWDSQPDPTVHAAAGHYISSAFDLVHNFGRSTAFLTSQEDVSLVDETWNEVNGGTDPYGEDDGRDKISEFVTAADDDALVAGLQDLLTTRPPALTVAHLSLLDDAGHQYGWLRPGYMSALTHADRLVGKVLHTVRSSPDLADRTLVVLTSEHGGRGTSHSDKRLTANYRVPFLVLGPGVPAGADLYDLNPTYVAPGRTRPGYSGAQPIRNGFVANLVTMALRLPALPGSTLNGRQDLTILPPG